MIESISWCCQSKECYQLLGYIKECGKWKKISEKIRKFEVEDQCQKWTILTVALDICVTIFKDYTVFFLYFFRVLNKDPYNSQCLPLHISVLVELKKSNSKSPNTRKDFE